MDDLATRQAHVIRRLSLLSEAATSSPPESKQTGHVKPGSRMPAGVRSKLQEGDRPPPKDRSLSDYWAWIFAHARDEEHGWRLLWLAERDLRAAVRRQPSFLWETEHERKIRVLAMYEGMAAAEAAICEDCSETWLRKFRSKHGHDPSTGEPLEVALTREDWNDVANGRDAEDASVAVGYGRAKP